MPPATGVSQMADHGEYMDDIFNVLSNTRRRRVLEMLRDADGGELTISNLAEAIAAEENDKDAHLLDAQERKRVYIGLYQCHLGRMDNAGLIDWDKDRGTATLTVDEYHDVFDHIDIANGEKVAVGEEEVDDGESGGVLSGWFGL